MLASYRLASRRKPAIRREDACASSTATGRATELHGETQIRTGDTTIFSRVLYQLSYLAADLTSIGIRCYCFSNSSTSAS
jgi:hypothetical protein